MTTQESNGNSIVNLVIGLSLMVFAAMVAMFIFKVVLSLAPVFGVLIAIGGGIWYMQAENEHYKLRAMQTILAGVGLAVLFGIIF